MIRTLLEEKYLSYNCPEFIDHDPVSIPHQYSIPENIEIAGFLTATIAWGQRKSIIANAQRLMKLLNNNPQEFLIHSSVKEFGGLKHFVHRTFNGLDTVYFLEALKNIYKYHGGMKSIFLSAFQQYGDLKQALIEFHKVFFELPHPARTEKHVANVAKGAGAKRLNMFLRWMIRDDGRGVDFGLWNEIPASALYIPLDIHTGNVARELGLLTRKQNDWRAVEELTAKLREFDANDPVKYDFALFGMGVNEKLSKTPRFEQE